MRFYCGVNPFIFILILFPCVIFAQVTPDIPIGVIKVQRPAIQPAYRVDMSIMYPQAKINSKIITEISPQQIVLSDTIFDPLAPKPSPGYMVPQNDSTHAVLGETFRGAQFNWYSYLTRIPYKFAWTDSTKLDSARFIYTINKNGNAECKFLPWINEDSIQSEFEGKAATYFFRLRKWIPARRVKKVSDGKATKTKRVACMVIFTVYAYDSNAGRILPVEVKER